MRLISRGGSAQAGEVQHVAEPTGVFGGPEDPHNPPVNAQLLAVDARQEPLATAERMRDGCGPNRGFVPCGLGRPERLDILARPVRAVFR